MKNMISFECYLLIDDKITSFGSGGLAVVGSGDLGGSDDAASKEITGDLLILGAQVRSNCLLLCNQFFI